MLQVDRRAGARVSSGDVQVLQGWWTAASFCGWGLQMGMPSVLGTGLDSSGSGGH